MADSIGDLATIVRLGLSSCRFEPLRVAVVSLFLCFWRGVSKGRWQRCILDHVLQRVLRPGILFILQSGTRLAWIGLGEDSWSSASFLNIGGVVFFLAT